MKERSARPSLTASKVCGAATTDFGSRLHFTRPDVAFSTSAQNGMVMSFTSRCVGGTQAFTLRVTCAEAGLARNAQANRPAASLIDFIEILPVIFREPNTKGRGLPTATEAGPDRPDSGPRVAGRSAWAQRHSAGGSAAQGNALLCARW